MTIQEWNHSHGQILCSGHVDWMKYMMYIQATREKKQKILVTIWAIRWPILKAYTRVRDIENLWH